ncbi:MAG: biopolymer transporter ExbD [Ignavibacteriales bacterium]|nr:biopolymer transporter ExbD [Ignavibacteriales bacterium]
MRFSTPQKPLAMFSHSSLTDIVFLLLIFFLLSSSFVIQSGIKVQLPKSESAEMESQRQIIVTVTEKGSIFLNDKLISLETLGGQLAPLVERDREKIVIIKADQTVSLQSAVQVMDIAKGVGASRLLIATQPGLDQ